MSNQTVIERFERSRAIFRGHCARSMPDNLYDRQAWNMAGV